MIKDVLATEPQAEVIDQPRRRFFWDRRHDDRGCPTRGNCIRCRPNQ